MVRATKKSKTLSMADARRGDALRPAKPLDRVRQAGMAALRPKSTKRLDRWCEDNLRLPGETEASSGKYDLTRRPYWRKFFEAVHDPDVERIYIQKSTQVGGTVACFAMLVALSELKPAPMMMVAPDQATVTELRDRVYGWAKACEVTRHRVPRERDWNSRHMDLGTCRIYLGYSGGRQSLRGRPCRVVFMTEVDVYRKGDKAGDAFSAARERVKAFYRRKIVAESSPAGDDSTIAKAYDQSNKLRWFGKCPCCGTLQPLRFFVYRSGEFRGRGGIAGFRDAEGNLLEDGEAREKAHYVCLRGCKITQDRKTEFIEQGCWVAEGQKVDKSGKKIIGEPKRDKRITGLHFWTIMNPTISFADLASTYIEKYHDGAIPEFWTDTLGLRYEPPTKLPKWNILGKRLKSDHARGEVPQGAYFLTAGSDVQEDRVYWVVRGWGDQMTSWLVDWGVLHRYEVAGDDEEDVLVPSATDIAQLEETILGRTWPIAGGGQNPHGRTELGVPLLNSDSNWRTAATHEWWMSLPPRLRRRVRLVRGDHKVDPRQLFRHSLVRKSSREGKEYKGGGMHQWGIYVNLLKERLAAKFSAGAGPGGFYLTRDVLIHGKEYLRQLVNEPRVITINKQGRREVKWQPISHRVGQDFWDCEIYAMAAAEMIVRKFPGQPGWQASKWPRPTKREPIAFIPPALASGSNVSVMR